MSGQRNGRENFSAGDRIQFTKTDKKAASSTAPPHHRAIDGCLSPCISTGGDDDDQLQRRGVQ